MPVSGCVLPIVIVLSVTPGPQLLPPPPPPPLLPPPQPAAASASTAPPPSRRMWEMRMFCLRGGADGGTILVANLPRGSNQGDKASYRPDDPAGCDEHGQGEQDAVNQQRQVVGHLAGTDREGVGEVLGPVVGEHHDENRAEHGTGEAAEAADDGCGEDRQRQREGERSR